MNVYWNQPVRLSMCIQNTSFCQSAGRVSKSLFVTAQVLINSRREDVETF